MGKIIINDRESTLPVETTNETVAFMRKKIPGLQKKDFVIYIIAEKRKEAVILASTVDGREGQPVKLKIEIPQKIPKTQVRKQPAPHPKTIPCTNCEQLQQYLSKTKER